MEILRGFALFGVLFVTMTIFSHPMQAIVLPADPNLPFYDRGALWLIHALGEGKFYALFSLLFGLELTLQMERIEGRGGRFAPLYAPRLLVLLGIGIVHAFLIGMAISSTRSGRVAVALADLPQAAAVSANLLMENSKR